MATLLWRSEPAARLRGLVAFTVWLGIGGVQLWGGSQLSPVALQPLGSQYTIGPEDVLGITIWKEPDLSVDSAVVRPDGKISLPLLNEVDATGLTPEELRTLITERAKRFVSDPRVSVVVREIRSRRVFITGSVANPGAFPLGGKTTVLQLIALAGGLSEFAKKKDIVVTRLENGKSMVLPFNYSDVIRGRNLQQNIVLRPGDTVVVP